MIILDTHSKRIGWTFVLLLALSSGHAHAIGLTWNGFASAYGRYDFTDVSTPPSSPRSLDVTHGTRVGLNIRSDFSEQWAAVAQMVASGERLPTAHSNPDWTPQFDWVFLSYTPFQGLNVKVGRQLYPNWLVAEYIDAGYTYPWRKPPAQVYTMSPFKSFEGASIAYQHSLGEQSLTARVFGGNALDTFPADQSAPIIVKNLLGVALAMDGDGWRAAATYSRFNLRFVEDTGITAGTSPAPGYPVFSQPVQVDVSADGEQIFTVGARYDRGGIMGYAEYGQTWSDNGTPILGSTFAHSAKGGYGTVGYHLGAWLPHYTLAYADWDIGLLSGKQLSQGFGLNYQIDPSVIIKAEYLWEKASDGPLLLSSIGTAQTVSLGLDVVF